MEGRGPPALIRDCGPVIPPDKRAEKNCEAMLLLLLIVHNHYILLIYCFVDRIVLQLLNVLKVYWVPSSYF